MKITTRMLVGTLAFVAVFPGRAASGRQAAPPVAIVCAITGTASVMVPAGQKATPIRLFEWISAGAVVEVAKGSTVTLVFSGGARYELGETAKVTAASDSFASRSGPVRKLDSVPPLPRFLPIADGAGPRSGAVRIRGARITHLYPDGGAVTLADSTVLQFAPIVEASRYRVDIETESGASVFQVETQSPLVHISPGILKPGAKYFWQVRSLDKAGEAARGAAEFVTLGVESAGARTALKTSLEAAGDATSLAFLAEIDRTLGLLLEARDGFRAALAKAPGDAALRQALDRVEQRLATERDQSLR